MSTFYKPSMNKKLLYYGLGVIILVFFFLAYGKDMVKSIDFPSSAENTVQQLLEFPETT